MEKYLLFAYRDYYPRGGMEDCILVADSFEELNLYIPKYIRDNEYDFDNMHYYDCQTSKTYAAEFDEDIFPKKHFIKWELEESQ